MDDPSMLNPERTESKVANIGPYSRILITVTGHLLRQLKRRVSHGSWVQKLQFMLLFQGPSTVRQNTMVKREIPGHSKATHLINIWKYGEKRQGVDTQRLRTTDLDSHGSSDHQSKSGM
ncbi:hypothetical protein STEG23_032905, partial [Scotinomys teguina]